MLDDLTTRDQRMLFAVVTLVHLADSKEELDSDMVMVQLLLLMAGMALLVFGSKRRSIPI